MEKASIEQQSDEITLKRCSICRQELPLEDFNKKKASPDGYSYVCRKCTRERENAWRRKRKAESEGCQQEPAPAKETDPLLLTINFDNLPEIFDEIKRMADAEDRTPELQARFLLRTHSLVKDAVAARQYQ